MRDAAAALIDFPVETPEAKTLRPWRPAARIAFRFCFTYFTLYIVCTQMFRGLIPFSINIPNISAVGPVRWMVEWAAAAIFGVTSPLVFFSGSGDKTTDWVLAFCMLLLSAAVTAAWSLASRRPVNYDRMHKWFRLLIRFSLGTTMIGYGASKVIPLQMPYPSLTRLLEPYGDFSPMGVLWASMGASPTYQSFTGVVEMAAGLLLCIPQTALLGAVLALIATIQIFTLNMTYDVPVKLFSLHLLLMSLLVLAPDAKRLLNVLLLNRHAGPSVVPPLGGSAAAIRIGVVLQMIAGLWFAGTALNRAVDNWHQFGGGAPKSPLYGIWTVRHMTIDGIERPPLVTDYDRYHRVIFDRPTGMAFQRMDHSFVNHAVKIDMGSGSMAVTKPGDQRWAANFTFNQPSAERLLMSGELDGRKIAMRLELLPRERFLLVTRGFNWVQEFPFNR